MTPHAAKWLIALFAPADRAESILGDLEEEHSQIAATAGAAAAHRWYWRQSLRTVVRLSSATLRTSPLQLLGYAFIGVMLGRMASTLPLQAVIAVLDRYRVFESSPTAYLLWLKDGSLVLQLLANLLVGALLALAARERAMLAAVAMVLARLALATGAVVYTANHPVPGYRWMLVWLGAFCAANLAGAVLVRTRQLAPRRAV